MTHAFGSRQRTWVTPPQRSVGGGDRFDLDRPAGLEQTGTDNCPRGAMLAGARMCSR